MDGWMDVCGIMERDIRLATANCCFLVNYAAAFIRV